MTPVAPWPTATEVLDTLTLRAGFNTNTVILGTTILGLAAGVVGVFAMLRKRSLTADAISHATLPGIAAAFLIASALDISGRTTPVLLLGAGVSAVLGVLCIHAILRHTRLREDAAIGIVLSVFFGAGVVGLSYIQANQPDGSAGLVGFIVGQAATIQPRDVLVLAAIAGVSLVAALLCIKELKLVCFNDAFARVDGWPVSIIDMIMMALVILITVAGLQAVGLILVIALLIIPPVAARFWTERLWLLVTLSGAFGALSGYLGSTVSSWFPNKPAGAVIVLTAGSIFTLSLLVAPARGVIAASFRRLRFQLRIAGEHLLEAAHDRGDASLPRSTIDSVARLRGWSPWFRWIILRSLRARGFTTRPAWDAVGVTQAGVERGAVVSRNHALWEQYLISHAEVAPNHVDWSVDQVEHILSEPIIAGLEADLAARGMKLTAASAESR